MAAESVGGGRRENPLAQAVARALAVLEIIASLRLARHLRRWLRLMEIEEGERTPCLLLLDPRFGAIRDFVLLA